MPLEGAYLYQTHKLDGKPRASYHGDQGEPYSCVNLDDQGSYVRVHSAEVAATYMAAFFEAVRQLDPDGAPDALIALIEGDALATILRRASEEDVREALAARWTGEPVPDTLDVITGHGRPVSDGEPGHACAYCGAPAAAGELGPDGTVWKCSGHLDYADPVTEAPLCLAVHADVLHPSMCTELEGHLGDHVSRSGDRVVVTWSQDAAPDTAQPEDIPLALETKGQEPGGIIGGGAIMITPALDEGYWAYRVKLSDAQAIVGFPKFGTVGIGFAQEEDWNTNLPFTCGAEEIYDHIEHNKGDDSITREDCLTAIRMIQDAVKAGKVTEAAL